MLTQEQANQLNLQQHALEAAQIGYNQVQAKLDKYDSLLNKIKNNYASYSPEQKARISSLMGGISAEYQNLKRQKQNYSLAQYEAQQQIGYYNNLATQQSAPQGGQRRRVIKVEPVVSSELDGRWEEPETPISEPITYTYDTTRTYPRGQAYSIYNQYANAFANGGTKGQTAYLRTLPNPYDIGGSEGLGRMQYAMLREGISPQQSYNFVRDWEEAHTP